MAEKNQKVKNQGEQWGEEKKGICLESAERKKVEYRKFMSKRGEDEYQKPFPTSSIGPQFLALLGHISYNSRPVFPPLAGGSTSLALSE